MILFLYHAYLYINIAVNYFTLNDTGRLFGDGAL
jgi:hypothetical protein